MYSAPSEKKYYLDKVEQPKLIYFHLENSSSYDIQISHSYILTSLEEMINFDVISENAHKTLYTIRYVSQIPIG